MQMTLAVKRCTRQQHWSMILRRAVRYRSSIHRHHGLRGAFAGSTASSIEADLDYGWVAYAAAKGGVNAIAACLAVEYAEHGVRVCGVAPGATGGAGGGNPVPSLGRGLLHHRRYPARGRRRPRLNDDTSISS